MKLLLLRQFKYVWILADPHGNFYLFWNLTLEQQKHLGKPITFLTCWKKYKLCGKNLRRIHLTCLTCKLRRVVAGFDPPLQPINIHQVWIRKNIPVWRKILIKNLLSIAEALS